MRKNSSPAILLGIPLAAIQTRGEVVCVGCSLEDARKTQAETGSLYEFTRTGVGREEDAFVMRVEWLNEPRRWEAIVGLSHRLVARASEDVFQQLTAEENRSHQMELIGLLRSDRVIDIAAVNILG